MLNRFPLLLTVCIVLIGCERAGPLEDDPDPTVNATLSQIQTRIFDTNCALSGCHAGGSPQLGMNLSAGLSHSNIVNVPSQEQSSLMRVAPGDPENSYLFRKVRGDTGISGARMPLGRPALGADDLELIRQWIADGALDN